MDTREFIEFCTREEARLKWYAEARGVAEELLAVKKETEQAEQARDKAIADRDAAVADLEAKKATYQREGEAALADLQRVIKEKTDLASAASARAAAELAQVRAHTEKAQARSRRAKRNWAASGGRHRGKEGDPGPARRPARRAASYQGAHRRGAQRVGRRGPDPPRLHQSAGGCRGPDPRSARRIGIAPRLHPAGRRLPRRQHGGGPRQHLLRHADPRGRQQRHAEPERQ